MSLFAYAVFVQSSSVNLMALAASYQTASLSSTNTTISTTANFRIDKQNCPSEAAVYVHGWIPINKSKVIEEQRERVDLSIKHSEYPRNITVKLFSWDSEVVWQQAKVNADQEGDGLANWILTFKDACPNVKVRVIAHSLGSRVVLSALYSLENSTKWKEERFNITSVHLMGAAVDNEKVSKNQSDIDHSPLDDGKVYGSAIERNVVNFTNLYNPEDDMLERVDPQEQKMDNNQTDVYPHYEKDDALGWLGNASINEADIPSNYEEKNVQNEILAIKDADVSGKCDVFPWNCTISANRTGDNHIGYMGFRDSTNSSRLISENGDGAISVVVCDWRRN